MIKNNVGLTQQTYKTLAKKVRKARRVLGRPMTYAEKILYAHVSQQTHLRAYDRGSHYVDFAPDRVAMQDATAQMALLQFMTCGKKRVAVPSSLHCDHLILAQKDARYDLKDAVDTNKEVYEFLAACSQKYGIDFWQPGAGIIHQVVLENYAFPGGMMIGTDSHTPNAGGLGMAAIGVGGSDACDVMAGLPWELKMPRLIGVKLTGNLSGWASAKDLILKLAGILTVKGGTGAIIEYFGEGAETLSCTGKATICNMGAELGATCSIFPYDLKMKEYLEATGRHKIAKLADTYRDYLQADPEVYETPHIFFDKIIEIDLSKVEPYINGPFTPDLATPISLFAEQVKQHGWPETVSAALIGSCTNSSYQDIARAASVAEDAYTQGLLLRAPFTITPGSEVVRQTVEEAGLLRAFSAMGASLLANACGPCIGMWKREGVKEKNSIITSFNRNFAKRNDGNPLTHAFVASPEIVTALAIAGRLTFNPLTDTVLNSQGEEVMLQEPHGDELPQQGFTNERYGYIAPPEDMLIDLPIYIDPESTRLQKLEPFAAWEGGDLHHLQLLIKVSEKCTTDHISMAGKWLKFRGHLDNISNNMLIGALNAFNGENNLVKNQIDGSYGAVPDVQRYYKSHKYGSVVIGEKNYGEGSSREHAAMEPRYLGVRIIVVKSFARIHETNLKKQGMLAATFADESDYDKIQEDDTISIVGLAAFTPGVSLTMVLHHADGSQDEIELYHTYNEQQIEWFKAGSALNYLNPANVLQ